MKKLISELVRKVLSENKFRKLSLDEIEGKTVDRVAHSTYEAEGVVALIFTDGSTLAIANVPSKNISYGILDKEENI